MRILYENWTYLHTYFSVYTWDKSVKKKNIEFLIEIYWILSFLSCDLWPNDTHVS